MKKLILSIIALGCLSACNVMDVNARETTNQRFDREQREMKAQQTKANQLLSAKYLGGQPGKISIQGAAVAEIDNKAQLDTRIKISQAVGTSYKTDVKMKATAIDETSNPTLSLNTDSKLTDKLADDKSYIAIGCAHLDSSLVDGLEKKDIEALSKSIASISANTVVLCGKANLNYQWITIAAHHLILMNADFSIKGSLGALSLITDQLSVVGKSKIETQGLNAGASVAAAPTLELSVLKTIDGDGSLELSSVGGNCTTH